MRLECSPVATQVNINTSVAITGSIPTNALIAVPNPSSASTIVSLKLLQMEEVLLIIQE